MHPDGSNKTQAGSSAGWIIDQWLQPHMEKDVKEGIKNYYNQLEEGKGLKVV